MLKEKVVQLLEAQVSIEPDKIMGLLETPPNRELGDVAFPCFILAKQLKKAPAVIAQELANELQDPLFTKVEANGPYLNFFVDRNQYAIQIMEDARAGRLLHSIGEGKPMIVEYSSPNIAKPFTLAHIRSTMIGQALKNIYGTMGYEAIGINHLGDWGTQFGKLISAYLRWGEEEKVVANPIPELLRLYVKFHEEVELHPELNLEDEGRAWFHRLEQGDEEAHRLWQWFVSESLKEFNRMYEKLNVHIDHFWGESYYQNQMDRVFNELKEKDLLVESKGALVVEVSEEIPPCIVLKNDGSTIYATRDIAAAIYRYEKFHPEQILYVVDARQSLHFQQVFGVIEKMGYEWAKQCKHIAFGLMKIEGESMSTRKGKAVLLEDVLDEAISKVKNIIDEKNPDLPNKDQVAEWVGVGAIVFNDLKNYYAHNVNFQWDEALNFDGETGPYVQYTYARMQSVLRKATVEWKEVPLQAHPAFQTPVAWDLLFHLTKYQEAMERAAEKYDPSQVARFVLDLCALFNRYYNQERLLVDDPAEQIAKLQLVDAAARVLKHGLEVLTLRTPEQI